MSPCVFHAGDWKMQIAQPARVISDMHVSDLVLFSTLNEFSCRVRVTACNVLERETVLGTLSGSGGTSSFTYSLK